MEDRRAAILSLRSFAREYKETVASGGLRGLIQTLARDYEDVDTAKVVLETLLLLFAKDETNVSDLKAKESTLLEYGSDGCGMWYEANNSGSQNLPVI